MITLSMSAGLRARLFIRTALVLTIATASITAQTKTSSPADDAILEAVVRQARADGKQFNCVMVSERDPADKMNPYTYLDPSPSLAARLRKQGLIRSLASSPDCHNPFWIGPVARDSKGVARVPAEMRDEVGMGRPGYVVKRNWFGRWRVTDFFGVE